MVRARGPVDLRRGGAGRLGRRRWSCRCRRGRRRAPAGSWPGDRVDRIALRVIRRCAGSGRGWSPALQVDLLVEDRGGGEAPVGHVLDDGSSIATVLDRVGVLGTDRDAQVLRGISRAGRCGRPDHRPRNRCRLGPSAVRCRARSARSHVEDPRRPGGAPRAITSASLGRDRQRLGAETAADEPVPGRSRRPAPARLQVGVQRRRRRCRAPSPGGTRGPPCRSSVSIVLASGSAPSWSSLHARTSSSSFASTWALRWENRSRTDSGMQVMSTGPSDTGSHCDAEAVGELGSEGGVVDPADRALLVLQEPGIQREPPAGRVLDLRRDHRVGVQLRIDGPGGVLAEHRDGRPRGCRPGGRRRSPVG